SARDVECRVRRHDREQHVRAQQLVPAHVAKACRTDAGRLAAPFRAPDDVGVDAAADRGTHLARMDEADDHRTSIITKTANATEMTPFIVKNAASSRRSSPGRTSECS